MAHLRAALFAHVLAAIWVGSGCVGDAPVSAYMSSAGERIVGGQESSELPAVGALTLHGNPHCTGTLIAPRKVLTAAHCVVGNDAADMRFVIGPSLDRAQSKMQVVQLEAHPGYNPNTISPDFDIAVVTLSSDAPVEPIAPLTAPLTEEWQGRTLLFVGYGASNGTTKKGGGIKRTVWMNIHEIQPLSFSHRDMGRNVCSGDSGGPALYQTDDGQYRVVGVTSTADVSCKILGTSARLDVDLAFLGLASTPSAPPPPPGCHGETFFGRCDGDTLIWCQDQTVHVTDCGLDGLTCQLDYQKNIHDCLDPQAIADPCRGETAEGRCAGDTLIWCQNQTVLSHDCSAMGNQCDIDPQTLRAVCMVAPPEDHGAPDIVEPCDGETAQGRCEGDTLIWCQDQSVHYFDCSATGDQCQVDAQNQAACSSPAVSTDPCGGETFVGRCEGDTLIWCDGVTVIIDNCWLYNSTCAWSPEGGIYACR